MGGLRGSGVPPYEFLNLYGIFSIAGFPLVFYGKRLELKSLKRGGRRLTSSGHGAPSSSAFVLPLKLFSSSRFSEKTGGKRRNRGCTAGGRTLRFFRRPYESSDAFLREGLCNQGASWAVCGTGVYTTIRFFKFVLCFSLQALHQFFLRNGSI